MVNFERVWARLTGKVRSWIEALLLHLPNLVVAVLVLVGAWLVARAVRSLVHRFLHRVSHSDQVNRLVSQAVYIGIVAAGLFAALGILGLQKTVASLLAGAGIVGLALGFAFQDIAANLMAGIYLSVKRPFRHGHLIKTQDYFGTVERIHLRWTEMRTQQGQLVLIPNKQVFENPLMNYTTTGRRRVDLSVGVSYGDDLARVREVAIRALEEVSNRTPDRPVELFYEELGESSINFVVRFWIPFSQQRDYMAARSEAIERLKRAFDAEGITIPFPTRTLDFAVKGGERLSEALAEAGIPELAGSRPRSGR
ncbi:MAG TPA: mechanosensitive ion channel family protein [Thermoanaerobaculia bacterium]|nr:mechanosensitive ion channel family protein [Thermoanaerobaculia bacterium]